MSILLVGGYPSLSLSLSIFESRKEDVFLFSPKYRVKTRQIESRKRSFERETLAGDKVKQK